MQEPSASEKRKRRINIATSFVSLLGLAVIDFGVFLYLPQYSTWAVVGTAALLAIYHPWWRHGIDKSKYDKILMDGQWLFVKKNSWRPVWVCESCNKITIDQIETGQMLPCRNCGHENESFLPNFWNGTDAVIETDRDRPRWVIVSDEAMRRRESASRSTLTVSTPTVRPSLAGETLPISSTKFCRECGAKMLRESTYCEECGSDESYDTDQ
jgi:hypothetical protein